MQPILSVIICTHNPRRNYLHRVLTALQKQTLPLEYWELVMVDNSSDTILASEIDLSWQPQAHHVREDKLGLVYARLRGIRESTAETLVFVDDDNVLDPQYLEIALRISKDYPLLGAWGGQAIPEFEETPPEWTKPYWHLLAIREFEDDCWSNLLNGETDPHGAGMCIRKTVAEKYAAIAINDAKRSQLDRRGNLLLCCGDTDMAYVACDLGLGVGRFTSLKLLHLIPATRLQKDYLLRVEEGSNYSVMILRSFRTKTLPLLQQSWRSSLYEFYRFWRKTPIDRQFYQASQRGKRLAIQELLHSGGFVSYPKEKIIRKSVEPIETSSEIHGIER
jgi:glycosyltransferase involved in cell wall biosynthesis